MTDQEFVAYRDDRYTKALEYYDKQAAKNKIFYNICSVYILLVSIAITPILMVDFSPDWNGKIIAALLSPTVAFVTGIVAHFKFHENWLSYRSTWDFLKHEIHERDAKVWAYKDAEDRNALFVERVEALISFEGTEWLARHISKKSNGAVRE